MYFLTIIPSISFYLFTLPMYFFSDHFDSGGFILVFLFFPFLLSYFSLLTGTSVGLISISFVSFFLFILFITKHVELWGQKKNRDREPESGSVGEEEE